ncbi:MAG: hypothetical protein AAF388_16125 [Bacteroidota bacterium]
MKVRLLCLALLLPVFVQSQTDEINISAAFTTSISLRITGDKNVEWVFSTIDHYTKGFNPVKRRVAFEVSASVNYRVELSMTEMTNAAGDVLDIRNIGFRADANGSDMVAKHGSTFVWATGSNPEYSGLFKSSTTPFPIILPGPDGNAGNYEDNQFRIRIGLGSSNVRNLTDMATLLDQNITPGTYTAVVTLEALPEFD